MCPTSWRLRFLTIFDVRMGNGVKYCFGLVVATIALFAMNILVGPSHIPVGDIVSILLGKSGENETWAYIIVQSRLPQAITATLGGAALAVSGLMLQTAFKNPLADPSIFGISGGAGLGVAIVMLLMGGGVTAGALSFGGFAAIFAGAFAGAMLVTAIIFLFSYLVRSNVLLLIIGIMIGYVSSSAVSLLNFFATEQGVKSYLVWGLGNFGGVSMSSMPLFAGVTIICIAVSISLVKPLNALLLGERYAENLGVDILRTRNTLLVVTGLLTAIITAFCGPVAFIGLAVPHMARLLLSTDNHRQLLPATILMGAVVALACNGICTLPGDSGVIPLNAVTPLIGAPVIIYVIIRKRYS